MSAESATSPSAKAAALKGSAGARSRRITRSVDTLRSLSSGGSVKPSRSTKPIAAPRSAGNGPGNGSVTVKKPVSQRASTPCAPYPARLPRAQAAAPSATNCHAWMKKRSAWVAPRQRIIAAASIWRCEKRRAASATATEASTTERSDARPRKRCARSSATRTSLLASRTPSMRSPRPSWGVISSRKRCTAAGSPLTSRRCVTRLPTWMRPVDSTSSACIRTRGARPK